jgi:hypothetical protein
VETSGLRESAQVARRPNCNFREDARRDELRGITTHKILRSFQPGWFYALDAKAIEKKYLEPPTRSIQRRSNQEVCVKDRRYVACLNEEERRKVAHNREPIVAHLREPLWSAISQLWC